ncbi:MAG: polymorphic toxin-type HINT domain-containing protein [Saprospiraceae bacterium]
MVTENQEVNELLFDLIEARSWSATKMRHFMELDEVSLGHILLDEPANATARTSAWSDLYSPADHMLVNSLLDDYIRVRQVEGLAELPDFVRASEENADIFKALYRSNFDEGSAALNPPKDNRDWLMGLLTDGGSGVTATFSDGTAVFRMATSTGSADEIARITAQGDILAAGTPVGSGWEPTDILHISHDGSRAIICRSGACEIRMGACFPAQTPIHTPAGMVAIEDIAIGDVVYAYDESQKDTILSRVTNTFSKTWSKMVRLVVNNDTITTTSNHPFFIPKLGRYLSADSLWRGMNLLALTGTLMTVQSAVAFDSTMAVYNFEVADHHNYFVGEDGVLVHNECVFVKLGLRNLPQETAADPIFDVLTNVFGTTPQATLNRMDFLEDYGRLSGQAKADFEAFFRGDDLLVANPSMTQEALLAAKESRVRAWGVAYQFTDPTDVSLLTRLANDMGDRPNLAAIITSHVDPDGAFNTWNRVSLGERFVAETKFYNVMDELVPPGVDYDFIWIDPNTGESFVWGAPTSGLKIYSNAPEGTFIIGGFFPDLKFLLPQFPTATIGHPTTLVLPDHVNQLNDWISAGFPQPIGSQFNLLNVYDPLFVHVLNNPQELVTYGVFTDRGAGKFFTFINGPWMDAAVQQDKLILVASDMSNYIYETPIKLSGFGKEVHRLEWVHGYRFNPANNTMVPPSEAIGLPTLTRAGDLDHGF